MTGFFEIFTANLAALTGPLWRLLSTYPVPHLSFGMLLPIPLIGAVYMALRHRRDLGRFRFWAVLRLLAHPRFFLHKSHGLDLLMLVVNSSVLVLLFSMAIVSTAAIHALMMTGLTGLFGAPSPTTLAPALVAAIWSVGMLLAFEFAYWLDHYLSHRLPVLWEFHKVHHSAEVLSPVTNFRVHPIDSIVYYNILAVIKGLAIGTLSYLFGAATMTLDVWGIAGGITIGASILSHMHHTQIWLPLRGWLGHLILSPAHHQIHHSSDRTHHDRNFGHILAVFDWAAGTLFMPPKQRPKLKFGVDSIVNPRHDLTENLVEPFYAAARHLTPAMPQSEPAFEHALHKAD